MNLWEKLKKWHRDNNSPQISTPTQQEFEFITVEGKDIHDLLEGEFLPTPYGECFVTEGIYNSDYLHGDIVLRDIFSYSPSLFAYMGKDANLSELNLEETAFLDIETTGLAVGAGTYVILVGIGYFKGGEFHIKQYFMRDYGEEMAFLWTLNDLLSCFSAVVTFNGKCFDIPILYNRYAYSRLRFNLEDPLHLDLLFSARRLWRERLESCGLSSLEQHILRVKRTEEDVPSYMIPSLYFQYIRTRDAREMKKVFYHNQQDILSLLALTVKLCDIYSDPFSTLEKGEDFYSLGKVYENLGLSEESVRCYEYALSASLTPATRNKTMCRLSFLYKRLRENKQAVMIWESLISNNQTYSLYPYIELAKYYEHQLKDYRKAIDTVKEALLMLNQRRTLFGRLYYERDLADLRHRLARLNRKEERRRG